MAKTTNNTVSYNINKRTVKVTKQFNYLPDITYKLDNLKMPLSEQDLFEITLWKIDRYPHITNNIVNELNNLRSQNNYNKEETKRVLKYLLDIDGVGLPMASAYLRFSNPQIYQIIDARSFRAAYDYQPPKSYVYAKRDEQINVYLAYLEKLHDIAINGYHGYTVDFKDLDRFLYDVDLELGFRIKDNPQCTKSEIDTAVATIYNNCKPTTNSNTKLKKAKKKATKP